MVTPLRGKLPMTHPRTRRELPRLRIAQVAPVQERVPPHRYGGTERVIYALTEELVERGHDVTLYATGDSTTSAHLKSVIPRGLRETRIEFVDHITYTLLNIGLAYNDQSNFDIIHDHHGILSLPVAHIARTPVLMTTHGPFTPQNRRMFELLKNVPLIAISKAQMRSGPFANFAGLVPNGLAMENYPFSPSHDGYLLFVGRISMEKGVHHAIEVAQYLNLPLIIAAKLETVDLPYFHEYIGPKLSHERIRWVGEVDEEARNHLMSRAMCFLHPVLWREPFGLTMIEAMACGCPVVAFGRGSIPEIVAHGRTGFVVSDTDGMIDAVLNINKIRRSECRRHALRNFNARTMADRYEVLYYERLTREAKHGSR